MVSSSLRTLLVTFITSAVSVSAVDPSLTLKSSTPNVNVDGLENLKVVTTVTNIGGETLKLLNDPRGVLNTFPENTFTITNLTGSRPSFSGAKIKYSPTYAAGLNDPNVFTVLNAGASINVTHDLSTAYNFTRSGAGAYSIKPSNLFTYVDTDGTPKDFYATVEDIPEVKLSGNLAVSRVHKKRASFAGCSSVDRILLDTAIDSAQDYATQTYSYIKGISKTTARYKTWFGTYTDSRKSTVEGGFRLISSHQFSSFSYNCACSNPYGYSYVYPDEFGVIYICGGFWNALNTGSDSRAGALIHEASHFTVNGRTEDYVYGQAKAMVLAADHPSRAIDNADNYQYFTENHPYLA